MEIERLKNGKLYILLDVKPYKTPVDGAGDLDENNIDDPNINTRDATFTCCKYHPYALCVGATHIKLQTETIAVSGRTVAGQPHKRTLLYFSVMGTPLKEYIPLDIIPSIDVAEMGYWLKVVNEVRLDLLFTACHVILAPGRFHPMLVVY